VRHDDESQEWGRVRQPYSGSINGVGARFQAFRINNLELVAQIFTSWNPLTSWIRKIGDYKAAA
jgi:hypothetical protein